MNITLAEQETILTMSADDRGTWHVFCDDEVMQRRLEKIGATLIRPAANGIGKFYELRSDMVFLRKGKRMVSEAQRAQNAERLRLYREAQ